jgi:hypothetical protein
MRRLHRARRPHRRGARARRCRRRRGPHLDRGAFTRTRSRPGLGIWLGAYGPRTLRLTGAKADGWLPSLGFLGLDRLGEVVARLDAGARDAGRDPASIRKIYNLNGVIGSASPHPFQGSIDQWVDQLVDVAQRFGMNGFVYWPNNDHDRQIALFAEEVVPAVRPALGG